MSAKTSRGELWARAAWGPMLAFTFALFSMIGEFSDSQFTPQLAWAAILWICFIPAYMIACIFLVVEPNEITKTNEILSLIAITVLALWFVFVLMLVGDVLMSMTGDISFFELLGKFRDA